MIGTVLLDRYEVVEQLGAGGMGVVYRALDRQTGTTVAAKVLASGGTEAQEHRLRREYRTLQRLRHPNIVAVLGWGLHGGLFFYVMEHVSGVTLRDYERTPDPALGAACRPGVERFLRATVNVLAALEAVHAAGIVHRDIKPQNVMVDAAGVVKLMDFGLVQGADGSVTESADGSMLGTVGYMAPEQVRGHRVDRRADLYGLGVVLYEYLTGRRPFVGDNAIAVLTKILNDRPTPPRLLCGWIGPGLEDVVLRLLAKNPDDRFPSAQALAEALRRLALAGAWVDPAEQSWSSGALVLPSTAGRLVGRQEQMEKLRASVDRAIRGRGQVVLVTGEAGVGKSRLVHEVPVALMGAGTLSLRGASYESEGIYYQPFLDLLTEYRRLAGIESSSRARIGLEAALRASFRQVEPELSVEVEEGEEPRAPARPDLAEQIKLFDLAARFVSRLSRRQPLLLVLEDLQWADEPTLELTRFLARNLKSERVILLLTCRTDDRTGTPARAHLPAFLSALNREHLVDLELPLARLDREGTADMAAGLLGREALPEGLVDAIHRHADGNPYFVGEIARAVSEAMASGTLMPTRGVFDLPLPRSASDLVERQLKRVGEEARRVVSLAALIGREVAFDVLKAISGMDEDPLLEVIDELLRAGLLEEVTGRDLDTYRFPQAITRSVLERETNRRKARRIHSAIAQAMEDLYHDRFEDRLDEAVEEIARHAFLAREHSKALLYALAAGQKAAGSYAFETAIRHLEMAFDVYAENPQLLSAEQAAALALHLGEAYERTGRLTQAREIHDEMLEELSPKGLPLPCADLAYAQAGVLESLGNFTAALEMLDRAQSLAADDPERLGAILLRRGDLWRLRGDAEAALELYSRVLATAEEQERADDVLLAMERIASVFLQNGEPREAHKYLERAIEQARTRGDRQRLGQLLAAEAQVHHDLFDAAREIASLEECLKVRREMGDQLGLLEPMGSLGRAHVRLGDLVKGVSYVEESLRRSRRYGVLANEAFRLRDLATVASYSGEAEAASAHLTAALDVAQRLRHAPAQFVISIDLALCRAALQRADEARGAATAARALALEKRNVFWLFRAESARAEVLLLALPSGASTREEVRAAVEEAHRVGSGVAELLAPPHFVPLHLATARLALREGDAAAAAASVDRAASALDGLVLPHLRARVWDARADLMEALGRPADRREALQEARAQYHRLGHRTRLEELDRALEELASRGPGDDDGR